MPKVGQNVRHGAAQHDDEYTMLYIYNIIYIIIYTYTYINLIYKLDIYHFQCGIFIVPHDNMTWPFYPLRNVHNLTMLSLYALSRRVACMSMLYNTQ